MPINCKTPKMTYDSGTKNQVTAVMTNPQQKICNPLFKYFGNSQAWLWFFALLKLIVIEMPTIKKKSEKIMILK